MDNDYWSKKNFENAFYRIPGTIMGDLARKNDEALKFNQPNVQPVQPKDHTGGKVVKQEPVKKKSKKRFLFSVDRWFEDHLTLRTRRILSFVLMVLGFLTGISYSVSLGMSAVGAATAGAIAGLLVIPLTILAVKLTVLALYIGLIGLALYVLYTTVGG